MDSNEEILKLIQDRFNLGKERYGHGLTVNHDTRKWGTKEDSWKEMALEEMLDGMIYITAQMIRKKDEKEEIEKLNKDIEKLNKENMKLKECNAMMKNYFHRVKDYINLVDLQNQDAFSIL